ncbi:efflux transporter outer membrane subunit [Pseudomonas matsuisoli]|uniref:RND transporter n=1 Tax=Pseudomonas matsuisoli TaxID=1515666 RepID=A0A917UR67_9PSED|nr:efflux transporter outer membrane subunit [Pseudomonas matsuisoli]GGJ78365.1 RND transporter [Pseudomonas matsuisoli]
MKKLPFAALLMLCLSGCGSLLTTDYQRPQLDVPTTWQQATTAATFKDADWWKAFNDPELDRLVNLALERNNDLGSALLNIRRARLQAGLTRDARFPQVSGAFSADRTRALRGEGSEAHSYSLTGSVSWDADLWNRLGAADDAATLEALATEQDYAATRLSLIGTVATLYWQIAYLNERIAQSDASIAYAEQTLGIVEAQYNAGGTSSLELAEARQSLETQRASAVELQQERVEQRNALAVLFDGATLPALTEPQILSRATLPDVNAGLPAALLARRPDLRASELRLRESLKTVDATRASYYPDLSLTGTLGYSSTALGMLLKDPVGALGAGITLPFLQWNQMRLDIAVSQTDYELAVKDFRQTLYEALSDVENNLAGRRHYAEQEAMRERALNNAREAERIYGVRYESGAETLQNWLTAQETRRSAETTLAENRLNQLLNYITLSEALGGGAQVPGEVLVTARP